MRFVPLAVLPALLLGACTKAAKDDTAGTDSNPVDTAADTQSPAIVSVDRVECTKEQSAGEIWSFTLTITDPQGVSSVNGGVVHALNAQDAELAQYDFPCDDSGSCNGSFRAAYDNVGCSLTGELVLGFDVTDIDGNASARFDYQTE
jgi:hypothetical protein